jgi:hypothetical protein
MRGFWSDCLDSAESFQTQKWKNRLFRQLLKLQLLPDRKKG